jgi:biopolymer transport protein ExbD
MLRLRTQREGSGGHAELNVIPLIDVVFFLLVFYVISTSFITETAVPLDRPASSRASAVNSSFVSLAIVKSGAILIGSRILDLGAVPDAIKLALDEAGATRVLVIPDRDVPTGLLLRVMDAAKAGGATAVDVAATRD